MHTLYRDLRFSLRHLTKSPGFAIIAVIVLALGIGANAAVFTILNSLLLKPLRGNAPGLFGVYARERAIPGSYRSFSYPELVDLRQCPEVFSHVAAFEMAVLGIKEGEGTRRGFGAIVSSDYFATIGTRIALGREFTVEEELAGSAPVAMLSHRLWHSLGADPTILGEPITVNGTAFTIVGVTPAGFSGTTALVTPEVWLPLGAYSLISNETLRGSGRSALSDRSTRSLLIVGRLRQGLTASDIRPLLAAVSSKLQHQSMGEDKDLELQVRPLSRLIAGAYPSNDSEASIALGFLMGMSVIVLLIASLNLANMMLARGGAREREIAIKMALGCSRWHVIRQLLLESLLLSTVGGAIGLGLGVIATRLLSKMLVPFVPPAFTFDTAPDWRILAATSVFSVMSTLVFGLGPALNLARTNLVAAIKQGTNPGGRGRRVRVGSALVAAQVALSLALLTAGGLFVEGARKASSSDMGLTLEGGVLINVDGSLAQYDEARSRRVMHEALSRIRALGEVASATVASVVPLGDYADGCTVQPIAAERAEAVGTFFTIIGADYFRTLGVPILRGREFSLSEEFQKRALCPAVVDITLAQKLWPGQDPIGRNLRIEDPGASKPAGLLEIVGVVPSIAPGLSRNNQATNLYVPYGNQFRSDMTIHVLGHSGGDVSESSLLQAALGELRAVDPKMPVLAAKTLRGHRDTSIYTLTARTAAQLFTAMALLALILASTGLYAVRAFIVSTRINEIGIRMAVGASRADAIMLVLGEGMRLALIGTSIGIALSVAVAWALAGWVYGVDTFEPRAMIGAPLVLLAALLLASYLPARRAAAIDPMVVIRQQ